VTTAATLPGHYTVERYLELGDAGVLDPDDRVELLDGLIVAMPPPSPPHDSAVQRVQYALLRKLGLHVSIRVQSSLLAGVASVPQPDVMVLPGKLEDYDRRLPSVAHLIVEVAYSSVAQDRLTKSAIYAKAEVPCYWIVNLRDHCVEVFADPDREVAVYRRIRRANGSDALTIDAYPGISFEAAEFLPAPDPTPATSDR
jgi:Uma2 family endonuclease